MYEYETKINRPILRKIPDFEQNDRLKHVILSLQFDRNLLERLCDIADKIRIISRLKDGQDFLRGLLNQKRVMLYFTQPSTRTFLSFMAACQLLGLACNEIRDTRLSSEYKGESPEDSVRMFSSYFDLIIMRSIVPNFAERCAYMMNELQDFNQRNVPIINAGAGADEHPTQALLDIYTLSRTFEFIDPRDTKDHTRFDTLKDKYRKQEIELTRGIDNKTIAFVGDIGRGRTVRSLSQLLSLYSNMTMYFVSPPHPKLKLQDDLKGFLESRNVKVLEGESIDDILEKVDAVYITRIQFEHDDDELRKYMKKTDIGKFSMTLPRAKKMRDYAAIMHPFPRTKEIDPEVDVNHRAMYFRQARNGMWIRAALIAYLFDTDYKIIKYYSDNYSQYQTYNLGVIGS